MLRRHAPVRARLLEGMVKANDWRIGVELGVLRGDTFLWLLKACPDLAMVGVDLWRPRPEQDGIEGGRSYAQHDLDLYYLRLAEAVERYGRRAALLRMDTVEAAAKYPDGHFCFAFIDADHTYEGVSRDIDAWRAKVRPGGFLLGHDYNERDFPGVVRAVNERFDPALHPDHVWAVSL